ncbi:uncharacterized protein DS421_5g144720 [Arachis hypogaea]|nr:uncharacterized protein DS421_5g144720 [Arachis hypogaea]
MSTRTNTRPNVLSPGRFTVLVGVTAKPNVLLVLPGLDNADVAKWDAETSLGLIQGTPLMKNCYCYWQHNNLEVDQDLIYISPIEGKGQTIEEEVSEIGSHFRYHHMRELNKSNPKQ